MDRLERIVIALWLVGAAAGVYIMYRLVSQLLALGSFYRTLQYGD